MSQYRSDLSQVRQNLMSNTTNLLNKLPDELTGEVRFSIVEN